MASPEDQDDRSKSYREAPDARLKSSAELGLSAITELKSDDADAAGAEALGQVIDNKYKLLAFVGKGGMSTVYRARHLATGKVVAVKLMNPHLVTDSSSVRRFQQEATASSKLTHPNSISVHDFGVTEDGQPFIVMDFLEGLSLAELIAKEGKVEVWRAIGIFIQACDALENAHKLRIIHRDLKPSNLMLVEERDTKDFVKVVDFGIAKILPQEGGEGLKLTTTGEIFGSPLYMSPEQCVGKPLDIRSDIYSFGCLMYETLTGTAPLVGQNVLETMYKQTNEAPPPLKNVNADVRIIKHLDTTIRKCLAKNPSQRYSSFKELENELSQLAVGAQGSKALASMQLGSTWASTQLVNRLGTSKRLVLALSVVAIFLALMIPTVLVVKLKDPGQFPTDRSLPLQPVPASRGADQNSRKAALMQGLERLQKSVGDQLKHFYSMKNQAYYYLQRNDWDGLRKAVAKLNNEGYPPEIDPNTSVDYADFKVMEATSLLYKEKPDYYAAERWAVIATKIYDNIDRRWLSEYSIRAQLVAAKAEILMARTHGGDIRLTAAKDHYLAFLQLVKDLKDASVSIDPWVVGNGLGDAAQFYLDNADRRGVVGISESDALNEAIKWYDSSNNHSWSIINDAAYNRAVTDNQLGLCYAKFATVPTLTDEQRQNFWKSAELAFENAYTKLNAATADKADLVKVLANLGDVQWKLNKFSEALQNYQQARRLQDFANDMQRAPAH